MPFSSLSRWMNQGTMRDEEKKKRLDLVPEQTTGSQCVHKSSVKHNYVSQESTCESLVSAPWRCSELSLESDHILFSLLLILWLLRRARLRKITLSANNKESSNCSDHMCLLSSKTRQGSVLRITYGTLSHINKNETSSQSCSRDHVRND